MKVLLTFLLLALSPLLPAATLSSASESACEAARELTGAIRDCDMSWVVDRMYPPLKRMYADQYSTRTRGDEVAAGQRFLGSSGETDKEAYTRMQASEKALRDHYMDMGRQMKEMDVRVESFTVSPAVAEYELTLPKSVAGAVRRDASGQTAADELKMGRNCSRLVILPTTLIVSVPDPRSGKRVRVEQKSHLFAVRDEVMENSGSGRGTEINRWYFIDGKTEVSTLRNFFMDIPLRLKLPITSSRQLN